MKIKKKKRLISTIINYHGTEIEIDLSVIAIAVTIAEVVNT